MEEEEEEALPLEIMERIFNLAFSDTKVYRPFVFREFAYRYNLKIPMLADTEERNFGYYRCPRGLECGYIDMLWKELFTYDSNVLIQATIGKTYKSEFFTTKVLYRFANCVLRYTKENVLFLSAFLEAFFLKCVSPKDVSRFCLISLNAKIPQTGYSVVIIDATDFEIPKEVVKLRNLQKNTFVVLCYREHEYVYENGEQVEREFRAAPEWALKRFSCIISPA